MWKVSKSGVPLNHPFTTGCSIGNHPTIGGLFYCNPHVQKWFVRACIYGFIRPIKFNQLHPKVIGDSQGISRIPLCFFGWVGLHPTWWNLIFPWNFEFAVDQDWGRWAWLHQNSVPNEDFTLKHADTVTIYVKIFNCGDSGPIFSPSFPEDDETKSGWWF